MSDSNTPQDGDNPHPALLWAEVQPKHKEHFRFLGSLSAQWQETVMEHCVLNSSSPLIYQHCVETNLDGKLVWEEVSFLHCMNYRSTEQYSVIGAAWTLF